MAQRPVLPLESGLGQIRAPSLQGDANEAAFIESLQSPLSGFFSNIISGQQEGNLSIAPTSRPSTSEDIDIFDAPMMGMPDESSGMAISGEAPTGGAGFGVPAILENVFRAGEAARPKGPPESYAAEQYEAGERTRKILKAAAEEQAAAAQAAEQATGDGTQQKTPAGDGVPDFVKQVPGADTPAKQAVTTALDEILKTTRPGVKPQDYKEYMKEFSDATGLDISGEPDNKAALMAFGLALMQNKAGKGFNVGDILSSVGEAGEKAMPALAEARKEARAIRAKAGEYAISRKREDEAAARNRQSIFIVPRTGEGKTEKERLANRLMKGRYVPLNSYELDALANNENFEAGYEIMPGDVLSKMGDLFKSPESPYMDKPETLTLFEDKNGKIDVQVRLPKAGNENLPSKLASSDQAENALAQLNNSRERIDQTEDRFNEFAQAFSETPPQAVPQAITSVVQFTRALGFLPITNFQTAVEGENDIQKQKRFLEWVGTSYAPEILQEAGKTISDADRERVNKLVGEITALGDPIKVAARVNQLHKLIIQSSRAKLAEGYRRLNNFGAGVEAPALTEEDKQELELLRSQVDSLLGGNE